MTAATVLAAIVWRRVLQGGEVALGAPTMPERDPAGMLDPLDGAALAADGAALARWSQSEHDVAAR